jgi:DivIVA domain-containing protein
VQDRGDLFRNAKFHQEVGGYRPKSVDRALKHWEASSITGTPIDPDELRAIQFGRALRGYERSDVDAFLDALAAGHEPPTIAPPGVRSFLATTLGGLVILAPYVALMGVYGISHRNWIGYVELFASAVVGVWFAVQWTRGSPGRHQARSINDG